MSHNNLLKYISITNIRNAFFHLRKFGIWSMFRKTQEYLEFTRNYNLWRTSHITPEEVLDTQRATQFSDMPKISIIVPVYKTPEIFLRQMIESVTSQTYYNWELCIADGSADTTSGYIQTVIKEYQNSYPNILYTKLSENRGISGNTNAALSLASGEYIALLDHDDLLTPDALFEVVSSINHNSDIDVLYTDEDKVDLSLKTYFDPYFKPDFNLDLLRSCNYITHFFVVRRAFAEKAGGFSPECNGSQDYDFILKTCEMAKKIHHIPKILYHWRIHPNSVAGNPESKTYAYDSAVRALQSHLDRCGECASASKDTAFGYYKVSYQFKGSPLISIILNNCASKLPEQIRAVSTYTNYEFVKDPANASGEFLIFLNHVKEIETSDWMERFLGNLFRNSVGIVGPKILYKKNRIWDAGLIFSENGQIHSPFRKYYTSDTGYCYRARIQQSCSILSPYCYMIKADLYFSSPEHSDIYNLCALLRKQNLSLVYLPDISVVCSPAKHEIRVLNQFSGTSDPFYNCNLSQTHMYHLK